MFDHLHIQRFERVGCIEDQGIAVFYFVNQANVAAMLGVNDKSSLYWAIVVRQNSISMVELHNLLSQAFLVYNVPFLYCSFCKPR